MITKKGTIKKSTLESFSRPRTNGIIAIKLLEGDQLIDAQITEGENDIILATAFGFANRFSETQVRAVGRNSQGMRGIRLRDDDETVAMVVVKRGGTLLTISENGFGKRTDISNYLSKSRGTKGVITLKTTPRNGKLISLLEVVDNDDLIIVTKGGMIIRQPVSKIKVISRATTGVKLINLNKQDKVFDITRIPAEEEEGTKEEDAEYVVESISDEEAKVRGLDKIQNLDDLPEVAEEDIQEDTQENTQENTEEKEEDSLED